MAASSVSRGVKHLLTWSGLELLLELFALIMLMLLPIELFAMLDIILMLLFLIVSLFDADIIIIIPFDLLPLLELFFFFIVLPMPTSPRSGETESVAVDALSVNKKTSVARGILFIFVVLRDNDCTRTTPAPRSFYL